MTLNVMSCYKGATMKIQKLIFLTPLMTAAWLGCSNQTEPSSQPSQRPAQQRTTITTSEHTFTSAFPASLKATFGATPVIELGFSGGFEGQAWSAVVNVTAEASNGHGTIPVTNAPEAKGYVQLGAGGGAVSESATSGTINFEISGGHLNATATVVPSKLSATIEGDLAIECWVLRSALGPSTIGTTGTDGSEPLVLDEEMKSPQCASFKQSLIK